MNLRNLIPWVLTGSLAASTFANFYLLDRLAAETARPPQPESATHSPGVSTAPPAVLPIRIVTHLGLTKAQCEMIEGAPCRSPIALTSPVRLISMAAMPVSR